MDFNWTDGPELSIMLVRENWRDYAAEVGPESDYVTAILGYTWHLYRDKRDMSWGWDSDRDTAKREAEQALAALIEKDRNEGDNS